GMGVTVPARISCGIAQAKISRQVDDLGARRVREQILDHLLRRTVWKRTECKVETELLPDGVLDRTQCRQRKGSKLREHLRHALAGAAFGRQQHDLRVRVAQK